MNQLVNQYKIKSVDILVVTIENHCSWYNYWQKKVQSINSHRLILKKKSTNKVKMSDSTQLKPSSIAVNTTTYSMSGVASLSYLT